MGRVTSEIRFRRGGASVTYSASYNNDRPAHVRIRIPYFKVLDSFTTDASKSRVEDGCIVLSPDFTRLKIKWQENSEAHRGTTADLLTAYRSCDTFEGVDSSGVQIVRSHTPFLLDDERKDLIEPLSFELVKQAFLKEFARRTADTASKE